MSTKAKGTSIEKIISQFEKVDFDEKMKLFEKIKEYVATEVEKNLTEAKIKVEQYSKLQALINQ